MSDKIKQLQSSYIATLGSERGKDVMTDLRVFCFATKSIFSTDPLEMARNAGRREVFERIMTIMKADYTERYELENDIY